MRGIRLFCSIGLALLTAGAGRALATTSGLFGTVVPIGGTPSDIVLDEQRGVLYIADFGSSTIDILTLADNTVHSSINVAPFPAAIAMSPNGTYLVSVHYANYGTSGSGLSTTVPAGGGNLVTAINLNTLAQTTYNLGSESPLGVSFVNTQSGDQGGLAIIVTTANIMTLDPETGQIMTLESLAQVAQTIPQSGPTLPAAFTQAAVSTSADGFTAWAVCEAGTGTQLIFWYNALTATFGGEGWITTIPLLPRVSVDLHGTHAMVGHAQFGANNDNTNADHLYLNMVALYSNAIASPTVASHAWDSVHNLIYAEIPDLAQTTQPALMIVDADNLTFEDRLNIPENLVGRSVLNQAGTIMYSISESGVTIFPVGSLNSYNRVYPGQEDVLIQTSFCNQSQVNQTFTLSDPGGNTTDFEITSKTPGIAFSPASGVTPATITVTAEPAAFVNAKGTSVGSLTINSSSAVNQPINVRVLVSNPDEDQRGSLVHVSGILSDIVADPGRNRFYITRQDRNKVLVFDGTTKSLITTLRTMTTPVGMTLAPAPYTNTPNKYLLVANSDSQLISVFDLDSLTADPPITLPGSDFGRSVAATNSTILALSLDGATVDGDVSVLDMITGFGTSMPTLGAWSNDASWLSAYSVLTASPNGADILMAGPDGHVSLYSAAAGSFTITRQDVKALSGAYAASSYANYVVGNYILNAALVPAGTLNTAGGNASGFTFIDQNGTASGYFTTSPTFGTAGAGSIQYFAALSSAAESPIPTVESTLLPSVEGYPSPDGTVSNNGSGANEKSQQVNFTRTVAPLATGEIIELTTSGFTVLGQNYAAAYQPPVLKSITNAADDTAKVAPGGLISVWGTNMSPVSVVASQVPLSTSLGQSCLSVAGTPVPLLFVSGTQINAQLPNTVLGNENVTVHTPGGVSNSLAFEVNSAAPSVFLSGVAGTTTGLATVFRAANNQIVNATNPIRQGDTLVIWLTGMGLTSPAVTPGLAAPTSPLASVTVPPTVTLGGTQLTVEYAGRAPGEVGVDQLNVFVPSSVTQGSSEPLVITQGGSSTTLNFRVVGN